VRQNDGFINVYSEPGQGTTIKIHFPRHRDMSEEAAPQRSEERRAAGGSETVFVVEDQPAVLGLARKILEGRGYKVLTATSPEKALQLIQNEPVKVHLLVTDVIMPEMNGRELAERLSAMYPDLVVLFMSGYAEDVIAERGVVEEGVHFLEKPFTAADLAAAVRVALDSRERP
jgi:CheY-like chemotaxis protein